MLSYTLFGPAGYTFFLPSVLCSCWDKKKAGRNELPLFFIIPDGPSFIFIVLETAPRPSQPFTLRKMHNGIACASSWRSVKIGGSQSQCTSHYCVRRKKRGWFIYICIYMCVDLSSGRRTCTEFSKALFALSFSMYTCICIHAIRRFHLGWNSTNNVRKN